jgi:hypothetical protein
MQPGSSELVTVRRMLAAMFVFGSLGTGAELVLLEHMEDVWQQIPVALIAIGCIALFIVAVNPAAGSIRARRLTMALFVASGIAGVVLHYQGNVEFELELRAGDISGRIRQFRRHQLSGDRDRRAHTSDYQRCRRSSRAV